MRAAVLAVCVILASGWAVAATLVDSAPFTTDWFEDNENGLWLGSGFAGCYVYPTAAVTGPEDDGVVGTMTAPVGANGWILGAVGWTAYPVRVQYIVQVLEVPPGEELTTSIGTSADAGNQDDVTVAFLHHTPHILSVNVISRNATFTGASQEWDDTGLTFAAGDWARLTLLIPESDSIKVSIAKWDDGTSTWGTPETRVVSAVDTTAAGGLILRDFKRLTAALIPSAGITTEQTMYVDFITVEDEYVEPAIVAAPSGWIEAGERLTLTAPEGSNYEWFKDDVSVSDDPPRVTGAFERTLVFNPVAESDAGTYTCSYDDGTMKVTVVTSPFELVVFAEGSLPAAGAAALAILALGAITAGVAALRRPR